MRRLVAIAAALLVVFVLLVKITWHFNLPRFSPLVENQDTWIVNSTRRPFSTSNSIWTLDRAETFELNHTPEEDPASLNNPRVKEQAVAEIANSREVVRYIANTANLEVEGSSLDVTPPYHLLVRIWVRQPSAQERTKKRWADLLEQVSVPTFLQIRISYVLTRETEGETSSLNLQRDGIHLLFKPPEEKSDWIFVIPEATYVHVGRLVQRLFADADPTESVRRGLLTSINGTDVPILDAGILFTEAALAEVWNDPRANICWECNTVLCWTTCVAQGSYKWSSLPGLNPYSVREIAKWSLEGSLFKGEQRFAYESVGGTLMGTARLPITYGNMTEDELFYDQLAVDVHRGKIPKILHHIWSGPKNKIPHEVQRAAAHCRKMHEERGWKYMFWDDETIRALPGMPRLPAMQNRPRLVRHYTDTLRYYLLHRFGGAYVDVDAYCVRPFDPLLKYAENAGMDFLANYEAQRTLGRNIANGILIAAPASPVLSAVILHLGNRLASSKVWAKRPPHEQTGPWVVTEVRDQWESWVEPHAVLLASTAFIPLTENEGSEFDDLDELFDFAKRQGSYTVQMYQSMKRNSLLKLIKSTREDEQVDGQYVSS